MEFDQYWYGPIIIAICILKKIIIQFIQKRSKKPPMKQLKKQQPQLLSLKARKKQIESTMEQFNTPSTFAKYSKMQRQIIKINAQIENFKTKDQPIEKQQSKSILNNSTIKNQAIKMIANCILLLIATRIQCKIMLFDIFPPISWLINDNNEINGGLVFAFTNILLQ